MLGEAGCGGAGLTMISVHKHLPDLSTVDPYHPPVCRHFLHHKVTLTTLLSSMQYMHTCVPAQLPIVQSWPPKFCCFKQLQRDEAAQWQSTCPVLWFVSGCAPKPHADNAGG